MEGAPERSLPKEARSKRPSKIIVIAVVAILIVAGLAAVVLFVGGGKATASIVTADKAVVVEGGTVNFSAATSTAKGTINNYTWNFGDGTPVVYTTTATTSHEFDVAGKYLVVVTIKDDQGNTATNWGNLVSITVSQPAVTVRDNATKPNAIFGASASAFKSPTTVSFDGNSSSAWSVELNTKGVYAAALSVNYVKTLTWDFGDGSATVSGNRTVAALVSHNYTGDGVVYCAKMTVTSIHDVNASYQQTVVVYPASYNPSAGVKNPDTIIEATIGNPHDLDPARDYESAGGEILQNVYETLVWYDGGSADKLKPMLATNVPTAANGGVSADGLNYTYHIREGVKFHSGNTMTPADVEFSLERVLIINHPASPAWMFGEVVIPDYYSYAGNEPAYLELVNKSIEVSGNDVIVHLAVPCPYLNQVLAYTVGSIVDKQVVLSHGPVTYRTPDAQLDKVDAGTGAYKFVAWSPSEYIRLERFDQYWQGPAKIKNVIIQLVTSVGTREMLLFSGEADIAYIDRQYTPDVRGKSYLRIMEKNPTFNVDFIGLNRNISTDGSSIDNGNIPATFFSDKNVRLAFANAFDYNKYLHDTLLDTAVEGNGAIPAGMVFYNASIPKYNTNLTAAAEYLTAAINPATGNSWIDDGFRLVIYYNDGNVVRRDGAQMFAENLMSLNPAKITVEVQAMEWSQYVSASDSGQLGCYFLGWAPDYADPQDYVQPFCHSHGLYGSTNHLPDTLDAAIEAAAIELNETTRGQMYSTISMQMYNDVYYLWVTQATNFHVERSWISGWYFNPMYSGQYFFALSKG